MHSFPLTMDSLINVLKTRENLWIPVVFPLSLILINVMWVGVTLQFATFMNQKFLLDKFILEIKTK